MKGLSFFTLNQIALFEASLLLYAQFISAQSPPFGNVSSSSTSSGSSLSPTPTTSSSITALLPKPICETTCTIRLIPTIISYPSQVRTQNETVTATVIPFVTSYPDGRVSTQFSTYMKYAGATTDSGNVLFTQPTSSEIVWETFGTTLTYPTTYIAFPTPSLILNSPEPTRPGQTASVCLPTFLPISLPAASTTRFIFPVDLQKLDPTGAAQPVFTILDNEAVVSSLVGGDPRTCSHGLRQAPESSFAPTSQTLAPVDTQLPVIHTSVAVLTQTGNTVFVNPQQQNIPGNNGGSTNDNGGTGNNNGGNGNNNGGTGNNNGGTGNNNGGTGNNNNGGTGDNQNDNSGGGLVGGLLGAIFGGLGIPTPSNLPNAGNNGGGQNNQSPGSGSGAGSPAPVIVNGATITPAGTNGGFVVNGQTVAPGAAATLPGGVAVSVPTGGSVVVVGGSTVTIPTSGTSSGSSSGTTTTNTGSSTTQSIGGAIASGIGARPNAGDMLNGGSMLWEAGALLGLLGFVGAL